MLKCRTAAGIMLNDSRRLQNASTNRVDLGAFLGTRVESTSSGKHGRINALASEVARHQQIPKTADFNFNSRRLQHFSKSNPIFACSQFTAAAPSEPAWFSPRSISCNCAPSHFNGNPFGECVRP